jgi:hypothetical protein
LPRQFRRHRAGFKVQARYDPGDDARRHAAKGERIVNANIDAFRRGHAAGGFARALAQGGVPTRVIARVVPRLDFEPGPVTPEVTRQWLQRLSTPDAESAAGRIFDSGEILSLESGRKALSS